MKISKIIEIEILISRLWQLEILLSKMEELNNCNSDIEVAFYTKKKGRTEINFKNHADNKNLIRRAIDYFQSELNLVKKKIEEIE